MAGATGLRYTFPRHNEGQTLFHETSPLFERMGTDEFAEAQHSRQLVEALQNRVQDLERINVDLEYRLEDQARQCLAAEKECMAIKREWSAKCETLQNEIAHWKSEHANEQVKCVKLRDQNSRTERELYRILQRKYELMRGDKSKPSEEIVQSSEEKPMVAINLSFFSY